MGMLDGERFSTNKRWNFRVGRNKIVLYVSRNVALHAICCTGLLFSHMCGSIFLEHSFFVCSHGPFGQSSSGVFIIISLILIAYKKFKEIKVQRFQQTQ